MAQQKGTMIRELIDRQVSAVLGSIIVSDWIESQTLRPDDLVVFNNSFLYRGNAKSVKSSEYLGCLVDKDGSVSGGSVVISGISLFHAEIRRLSARQAEALVVQTVRDAVSVQRQNLGDVIFSLVARVGNDEPASVRLSDNMHVRSLHYKPDSEHLVALNGDEITLGELDNPELIWSKVKDLLSRDGETPEEYEIPFRRQFNELANSIHAPVYLRDVSDRYKSILGSMIDRLEKQVSDYSTSLQKHLENPSLSEPKNEILRIAYNFADGAGQIMSIVTAISDIKPLVLWMTIGAQFELASSLKLVPLYLTGKEKADFRRYRDMISNARNQSFHDIFSLGRTYNIELPESTFRGAQISLFRGYSNTKSSSLTFEDKAIVDLLESLTRTPEKSVPIGFWEANLGVMHNTVKVARTLRDALTLLR